MPSQNRAFDQKIPLPFGLKQPVLALGSQTNNTVCFIYGSTAYISRIHPDLSLPQDASCFDKDVKKFFKKCPQIIACDLHPEYASTKYARRLCDIANARRTTPRLRSGQAHDAPRQIQHHHAHIASCMAENGLKNTPVIGVAFDGTGLGTDQTLWGGEFLIADYKNFKRGAHLREIPLLGGEEAIRQPWRLAAAWLYHTYKNKFLGIDTGFIRGIDKNKWRILEKMQLADFNSPRSSSIGRLFDAAASIIFKIYRVNSQAQLAIALEEAAQSVRNPQLKPYMFKIIKKNDLSIIDPAMMFKELVSDIKHSRCPEEMAYRFHLSVAEMIKKTCLILKKKHKIDRVVLSGGVFQNSLLLRMSLALLYRQGFSVFTHKKISCNDSGISLGQAAIAAQSL